MCHIGTKAVKAHVRLSLLSSPLVVETRKQPGPLIFIQKRPRQSMHEKERNFWYVKPLRFGVCLLWQLALIILTNALPLASLSGQPSEAEDPVDPSLASHNSPAGVHV